MHESILCIGGYTYWVSYISHYMNRLKMMRAMNILYVCAWINFFSLDFWLNERPSYMQEIKRNFAHAMLYFSSFKWMAI